MRTYIEKEPRKIQDSKTSKQSCARNAFKENLTTS